MQATAAAKPPDPGSASVGIVPVITKLRLMEMQLPGKYKENFDFSSPGPLSED